MIEIKIKEDGVEKWVTLSELRKITSQGNTKQDLINKTFKESVFKRDYILEFGNEMLSEFYEYWSEMNHSGKKMRYQMEKTFNVGMRIKVWARKDYSGFYDKHKAEKRIKGQAEKTSEMHDKYGEEHTVEFNSFLKDISTKIGGGHKAEVSNHEQSRDDGRI